MTQFWRNKVLTVAKEYPEMQFAVADETGFETKLSELKLSESGEEVNVAIYDENDYRYALVDEEFSEETLVEFIEEFKKGKTSGLRYSRIDEVKLVEDSLLKILLGPFLNTLTHLWHQHNRKT